MQRYDLTALNRSFKIYIYTHSHMPYHISTLSKFDQYSVCGGSRYLSHKILLTCHKSEYSLTQLVCSIKFIFILNRCKLFFLCYMYESKLPSTFPTHKGTHEKNGRIKVMSRALNPFQRESTQAAEITSQDFYILLGQNIAAVLNYMWIYGCVCGSHHLNNLLNCLSCWNVSIFFQHTRKGLPYNLFDYLLFHTPQPPRGGYSNHTTFRHIHCLRTESPSWSVWEYFSQFLNECLSICIILC